MRQPPKSSSGPFWENGCLGSRHSLWRTFTTSATAIAAIQTLTNTGTIATMDSSHVMQALASGHSDFEDEIQIACGSAVTGLTAIITRNLSDYSNSPVPAVTAQAWLEQHPAASQE